MALDIRALALAGALAGTTILAVPAAAAPLATPLTPGGLGAPASTFDYSRFDPASTTADWRCRGWGWGCGRWGHRGWRRDRVDAGDVLIGAAIIGGIVAIASSNNRRERDVVVVRDNDWRYDTRRYDDRRADRRGGGASGLDSAVDQCLARIERDVRVDTVDNVERTGAGWMVSGALFNGSPFRCRIGNDGRIDSVDFGAGGFGGGDRGAAPAAVSAPRNDGQWSDQRYASARAAVGGTVRPDMAVSGASLPAVAASGAAMPAYPGGPVPGEEIPVSGPETIDGDIGG